MNKVRYFMSYVYHTRVNKIQVSGVDNQPRMGGGSTIRDFPEVESDADLTALKYALGEELQVDNLEITQLYRV